MTKSEWNAENRWQPDPALWLSRLYHPAISKDHPTFGRLPAKEQQLATALHRQFDRWSHKLYFKHGLSGRLIAALNGYNFANKLADCMVKANPYAKHLHYGRCFLDWFCEFCAYLKGQDLLKKYAGAWVPGGWYEMVISLEIGVCPSDPAHDYMRDLLEAMVTAVKKLQERKQMRGYVAWIEIKVHQFYPYLLCTPHIHVLFRCDSSPDLRVFGMFVADEWLRRQLEAVPNLFIAPVKSEGHFYELLTYVKPIDLLGPYDRGYRAARAANGAGQLDLFHQEVREFFLALNVETTDYQERYCKRTRQYKLMPVTRRRFLYGGDCHGTAKRPLGLKAAVRRTKAHQDAIRTKVELAREAEEQSREADEH
jgi:hypothetical protein